MTIPNIITIIRFLLVPVIVLCLMKDAVGWALAGFVIAGVSDGVDGFIARQFNQRSELGAYLDPLADKLLLVSVFVVLGYMDELPLWLVIAAVSRDALIVGGVMLSTIMGNPVPVQPLFISKANTAVQIVLAILVLAQLAFSIEGEGLRFTLVIVSGVLTAGSAGAYLVGWMRHMSGDGQGSAERKS